eukprot:g80605.t1
MIFYADKAHPGSSRKEPKLEAKRAEYRRVMTSQLERDVGRAECCEEHFAEEAMQRLKEYEADKAAIRDDDKAEHECCYQAHAAPAVQTYVEDPGVETALEPEETSVEPVPKGISSKMFVQWKGPYQVLEVVRAPINFKAGYGRNASCQLTSSGGSSSTVELDRPQLLSQHPRRFIQKFTKFEYVLFLCFWFFRRTGNAPTHQNGERVKTYIDQQRHLCRALRPKHRSSNPLP